MICGDLPTDYIPAEGIEHARDAMRAFGERWIEAADYMACGKSYPGMEIGIPSDWPTLAPLLTSRAELLKEWADLESLWGNSVLTWRSTRTPRARGFALAASRRLP